MDIARSRRISAVGNDLAGVTAPFRLDDATRSFYESANRPEQVPWRPGLQRITEPMLKRDADAGAGGPARPGPRRRDRRGPRGRPANGRNGRKRLTAIVASDRMRAPADLPQASGTTTAQG